MTTATEHQAERQAERIKQRHMREQNNLFSRLPATYAASRLQGQRILQQASGLSIVEWRVLWDLSEAGPMTIRDLAEIQRIEAQASLMLMTVFAGIAQLFAGEIRAEHPHATTGNAALQLDPEDCPAIHRVDRCRKTIFGGQPVPAIGRCFALQPAMGPLMIDVHDIGHERRQQILIGE